MRGHKIRQVFIKCWVKIFLTFCLKLHGKNQWNGGNIPFFGVGHWNLFYQSCNENRTLTSESSKSRQVATQIQNLRLEAVKDRNALLSIAREIDATIMSLRLTPKRAVLRRNLRRSPAPEATTESGEVDGARWCVAELRHASDTSARAGCANSRQERK